LEPTFSDYVLDRVMTALREIPPAIRSDIYVVSLFVYDEDDDPRRPTVTSDYNTRSQAGDDDGDLERRWNYACWEQNHLQLIADSVHDPTGALLREHWVRDELGLWYDDGEIFDPRGEPITRAFIEMLIGVTQNLHAEGGIAELFADEVPVLIHELEYYPEIAEQNIRANPPGLVPAGFVAWCNGGS
jgi:hypothetical protein